MNQIYLFKDVENLVNQFENVLNRNGINITHGSELERICLNVTNILEQHLNPKLRDNKTDIRPYFREFVGLQDLISKIVKSESNPNFSLLIQHLQTLNNKNPLQNISTSVLNQDNDKIFELYLATLCLNLNPTDIKVDNPKSSKGDNPDIISVFNNKKWGFGCKSLHSSNYKSIYDNVEKAVSQIENSESEIGIPVISIKNIIDHNSFWPIINEKDYLNGEEPVFGSFIDLSYPLATLQKYVNDIYEELISNIGESQLLQLFYNKKSVEGIFIFCSTTSAIASVNYPLVTRLNIFHLVRFGNISSDVFSILNNLNHQLQLIK